MSAAIDGIKVAEAMALSINANNKWDGFLLLDITSLSHRGFQTEHSSHHPQMYC
jgi:hypothetical protein